MDDIPTNLSQSQKKANENQRFTAPLLEKKINTYFDKITELQAGDIITHKGCKLCNHPLRGEAESLWEQTKGQHGRGSYARVIKFLNDRKDDHGGIIFHSQNVASHLNNHYEQQIKRINMRAYGSRLADIINYKINKDQMLETLGQALYLKTLEILADPEIPVLKQGEAAAKLSKEVLNICVTQANLRGELNVVDIYTEKFQNIIVKFIATEDDQVRQKDLIAQLDLARQEITDADET